MSNNTADEAFANWCDIETGVPLEDVYRPKPIELVEPPEPSPFTDEELQAALARVRSHFTTEDVTTFTTLSSEIPMKKLALKLAIVGFAAITTFGLVYGSIRKLSV